MSEHAVDHATVEEFTETAREKFATVQEGSQEFLKAAADYIKANPMIAVVGAAVIGGAIVALAKPANKSTHPNVDTIREWFDDAYAKLPSQKKVQKMAESAGIPKKFLSQLAKALHISS